MASTADGTPHRPPAGHRPAVAWRAETFPETHLWGKPSAVLGEGLHSFAGKPAARANSTAVAAAEEVEHMTVLWLGPEASVRRSHHRGGCFQVNDSCARGALPFA